VPAARRQVTLIEKSYHAVDAAIGAYVLLLVSMLVSTACSFSLSLSVFREILCSCDYADVGGVRQFNSSVVGAPFISPVKSGVCIWSS
jgi:hypothetical protein